MKRSLYGGLVILAVLFFLTSVVAAQDTSQWSKTKGRKPVIILKEKELERDPNIKVFKIKKVSITNKQALAVTKLLFGETKMLQEGKSSFDFVDRKDPSISFSMDRARGDINFSKGLRRYFGDFKPRLPRDKKAATLAQDYLRSMQLMPHGVGTVVVAHVGGLMAALIEDKPRPIKKLVTISYAREIDRRRVYGVGSKMVVQVGHKGEIVQVMKKWSTVEKEPIMELKGIEAFLSSQDVYKAIKDHLTKRWKTTNKIEVEIPQLAYYDRGGAYIQPVYVFTAKIYGEVGTIDYLGVVPALKKVYERIDPPRIKRWPSKTLKEGRKRKDAE